MAAVTDEHGGAPVDGNGSPKCSRRGLGCRRGRQLVGEVKERKCAWAAMVFDRRVCYHDYWEDGSAGGYLQDGGVQEYVGEGDDDVGGTTGLMRGQQWRWREVWSEKMEVKAWGALAAWRGDGMAMVLPLGFRLWQISGRRQLYEED